MDNAPSVIALIGPMQSGKDTICRELRRSNLFDNVRRYSFADEVKREEGEARGLALEDVEARKHELRPALQARGQGKRQGDPGYWIDRLMPNISAASEGTAVITDCRYLNEARALLAIGAVLVRVDTPTHVRFERYRKANPDRTLDDFAEVSAHDSEQEWRNSPHHLRFPGTLPEDEIAERMMKDLDAVTPESLVVPEGPTNRPLVYIAGPISQGNTHHNTHRAIQAWHGLWDAGYTPICPHVNSSLEYYRTLEYEEWMEFDLDLVRRCDVVFRLDGPSEGADREVAEAKRLGIPVWCEGDPPFVIDTASQYPRAIAMA